MRKPEWLAEVIVQSIAVTVSILLALWVGQWKERRTERNLARESMENFVSEIHQNELRMDDVLPYHEALQSNLQQVEAAHSIHTQADFQSAIGIDGLRPPSLLQTAWQTAIATGALTHLDYETVAALSLTYTLQDRFREDSRSGFQNLIQASDFRPGGADLAVHRADTYLREVLNSERDLRATYKQAEQVLVKKLKAVGVAATADTSRTPTLSFTGQ
ncbi:MAG: hypothetical protein M3R65_04570 [Gemmatimonadota bacterium]|nr:hypothetical protein [Gemmatimonadota bacterium]